MDKSSLEKIAGGIAVGAMIGAGLVFTGILLYSSAKILSNVEQGLEKGSPQQEVYYYPEENSE